MRLDGRAVVITGAGQGVGEACARYAASLGARVVVNDVDAASAKRVAAAIRDLGGLAVAHPADVSVRSEAAGLVDRCVDEHGHIHGLVNNAALMSLGRLEDHDEVHLRRLLDVNVVGGFNCAAEAIVPMKDEGSGSIVNVTSGAHLGLTEMSDYAATKGAVASMTYAWAADTAGTGVRVNALSPLATSAMTATAQRYYASTGRTDVVITAPQAAANAPAVAFLLSPASVHVTGQIVRVDGSQLSLMAHPAITTPVLERDVWTADDVDRAFAQVLGARQSPVGLSWTTDPPSSSPPRPLPFA